MSLNARAGGGGGQGLAVRLSSYPIGVVGWLPGREAPRGRGAQGSPLQPCGGRGGGDGLAAEIGSAGEGAAAGDRRREPEGTARGEPFPSW